MQKKITFYVFFVFFKIPKFLDGVMGCWSTVHKGTPVGERLSEFPFPLIHYSLSASGSCRTGRHYSKINRKGKEIE